MKYCSTDQTMIMKSNTLTNHVAIFYYPILRGKRALMREVYNQCVLNSIQVKAVLTTLCNTKLYNARLMTAIIPYTLKWGSPQDLEHLSTALHNVDMLPGLQVQLQQDIQTLQEIASHSTTSATDYRSYSAVTDDGSPETSSKSSKCMVGNFTFSEIL